MELGNRILHFGTIWSDSLDATFAALWTANYVLLTRVACHDRLPKERGELG